MSCFTWKICLSVCPLLQKASHHWYFAIWMSGNSIGRPSLQICTFVTFHFFCHWLFFLAIGNIVYLSSEYLQYLIKCSISPQRYRSLFGLLSSQLENLQPLLGNPLSPGPCVFPFKSVFESFGAFTSFPLIFLPSSHSDLLLFF